MLPDGPLAHGSVKKSTECAARAEHVLGHRRGRARPGHARPDLFTDPHARGSVPLSNQRSRYRATTVREWLAFFTSLLDREGHLLNRSPAPAGEIARSLRLSL